MTAAFIPLADSVPSPAPDIRLETPQDGPAIEALLDHAFGPGRLAKASERVREFAPCGPICPSAPGKARGWWAWCASLRSLWASAG